MTSTEPTPMLGRCGQADDRTPHLPHVVDVAHCAHETTTYCYGVPEPGSIGAAIESLQPGQRVRIVWEGVVGRPVRGPMDVHNREAVVANHVGDHFVLRYTGSSPYHQDAPADVAGRLNSGVVAIEVVS